MNKARRISGQKGSFEGMLRARSLLENPDSLSPILSQARVQRSPSLSLPIRSLLPIASFQFNHAIEFHGLAGSGKTHLLYGLAMDAVVNGRAVIVFDLEMKWDDARLLRLLTTRLARAAGIEGDYEPSEGLFEEEAKRMLDLVFCHHPQSQQAFMDDIEGVQDLCTNQIRDHGVWYILVDSMSAFHWQSVAVKSPSILDLYTALRACASHIAALLIYTSWDLGFRYLALPHSTRLLVVRKRVLQFTQGLKQAIETKEDRQMVLEKGIFHVTNESNGKRASFFVNEVDSGPLIP